MDPKRFYWWLGFAWLVLSGPTVLGAAQSDVSAFEWLGLAVWLSAIAAFCAYTFRAWRSRGNRGTTDPK